MSNTDVQYTNSVIGRVSIIVPCYNGERYIKRCLTSILNQTWKDTELILVNDGSTDKTHEIIEKNRDNIEKHLSRFIYLVQENKGVGATVNMALKYISGEYLVLFDCDDYMLPEAIEIKANWLNDHPQTTVVQSNGYYVTEDTFDEQSHKFCDMKDIKENIPLFDWIIDGKSYNWAGSYMIRVSSWLHYFPTREIYPSRSGQNFQILLPALYRNKCDYIPDCLMKYVKHVDSLSGVYSISQEIKNLLGYQDIAIVVLKSILSERDYQIYKRRIEINYSRRILNIALENQNKNISKEYYKKLKKLHGISLEDKIYYYRINNAVCHYLLRIYRKTIFLFNSKCKLEGKHE